VATVFQYARLSASGSVDMDLDALCEFVVSYCLRALGASEVAVARKKARALH